MIFQDNPLVSVIMPAYNCEKYIEKAVNSVLNQTYGNFELIIIDDCSKDSTAAIAKTLSEKDSRIHFIQNALNQGVSKTRNRGIAEAKGEYIALLDSDDIWVTNKIEKQLTLLFEADADLVFASYGFIDINDNEIKRPFIVPAETNYDKMLSVNVISCSTVFLKAELLKKHFFSSNIYHEDYALWMELLKIPIKAVGVTDVLAYYRQLQGSRNEKKLNAAKERWKIYRKVLKLNLFESSISFIGYAIAGIKKYYLS